MKTFSKTVKFFFTIFLSILSLLLVSLILLFMISPIFNNQSAARIKQQLMNSPLPESSELCEGYSAAGKLTGNGNGMQFLGVILIRTELSQEELDTYYDSFREGEFDYLVEPQPISSLELLETRSFHFNFTNWQEAEPPLQNYIVYTWGAGNRFFSQFDLRGH